MAAQVTWNLPHSSWGLQVCRTPASLSSRVHLLHPWPGSLSRAGEPHLVYILGSLTVLGGVAHAPCTLKGTVGLSPLSTPTSEKDSSEKPGQLE